MLCYGIRTAARIKLQALIASVCAAKVLLPVGAGIGAGGEGYCGRVFILHSCTSGRVIFYEPVSLIHAEARSYNLKFTYYFLGSVLGQQMAEWVVWQCIIPSTAYLAL